MTWNRVESFFCRPAIRVAYSMRAAMPVLVERQEAVLVADLLDEPDVVADGLVVLGHLRIELGLDLEDLLEILVLEVEEVVDIGVADHDDLDVGT